MTLDLTFIQTLTPMTVPAFMAAGYWAIGYIESLHYGESFDLPATIKTLGAGVLVAFLQALSGMTVDPAGITSLMGFDALVVIALSKVFTAITKQQAPATVASTSTAPITAPVAAATAPGTYMKANREWLTFDATPENKATILKQIDAAEALNLYTYKITFAGGYYRIENGQLVSSAGNPSGK